MGTTMAERTVTDLCRDVARRYEEVHGHAMNGEGVGFIVGEFLEGFVHTPGNFPLPDKINAALIAIGHYAREQGGLD